MHRRRTNHTYCLAFLDILLDGRLSINYGR
jgi:hypothetical protein